MQNKESLQNKFKNFGAQPTDALWSSIASNLDKKRKKKAILFWWIGSGTVTILGLLFGLSIYFNDTNSTIKITSLDISNTPKITNSNVDLYKEGSTLKGSIQTVNIETEKELDGSNELKAKHKINNVDKIQTKTNTQINTPASQPIVKTIKTKSKSQLFFERLKANSYRDLKSEKTNSEGITLLHTNNKHQLSCKGCNSTIKPRKIELITTFYNENVGLSHLTAPKKSKLFEYSLNVMTFFTIKNKVQYNTPNQTANSDGSFAINESLSPIISPQVQTSIPLTLRFGVATPLSKRFKIQTGLDFGWIRTAPINTENLFPKSSNFTVGIPLFLNFNIIDRRRFAINSKLGAINDFTFSEYKKGYQKSVLMITKGFLGGVEVGLSFDYKLNEKLKIGIGTDLRKYYYQSKPVLNFTTVKNAFYSLNVGLVWNY